MQTRFWARRAALATVWGFAVSTWASIGHYLMGLPDVGPLLVIGTVILILALPAGRARSSQGAPSRSDTRVDPILPSA